MSLKAWNGSAWVIAAALKTWNGSIWVDRPGQYWNGSAWVYFTQQTQQYPAIKTRSYDGSISHGDNPYAERWRADTPLRQGRFLEDPTGYNGPFYGTMHFGSGTGNPTELSTKILVSARIYLKRYNESGDESPINVKIWASTLTDVPGAGASSPPGNVTGIEQILGTLVRNEAKWFALPNAMAQNVIDGKCLALYYGNSNYQKIYGVENASYKPVIEITYR